MSNKCNSNGAAPNNTFIAPCVCTACGKKSECKCNRCGDFYCSEDCQRRDWPNHRFICFPMPKLVKVGQCSNVIDAPSKDVPSQITKNNSNSSKNGTVLPNGSCVLLTAFKSTNSCFIRSTNPSSVAEYERVLNEVNENGKKSPEMTEKPKNNSQVLALRGEKWCRANVLGYKDNYFRVAYTDFGDLGNRSLSEIRKITSASLNLPCIVHKVQLKGVVFCTQQKIMRALNQYTNKEYKVEFVQPDKNGGNVELFQWGSSVLINSKIQDLFSKHSENDIDRNSVGSSSSNLKVQENEVVDQKQNEEDINKSRIQKSPISDFSENLKNDVKTNNTKTTQSTNDKLEKLAGNSLPVINTEKNEKKSVPRQIQMQKPCLVPPFDIIPMNEGDRGSKIMIMDNSYIEMGFVGCLLEKYYENLKAVTKFLTEYNVGDQAYKPKLNEYCLANFDKVWYRAKVVEILSEDEFLVVYIDFTNEKELTSEFIRRYPLSLDLPCCTTLCALDGVPEASSRQLKNFLEENCHSFTILNIDSVRMLDGVLYVKSLELLNKLRDSKLI